MYKKKLFNFRFTPSISKRTRLKQKKRFDRQCRRVFKPQHPDNPLTDEDKIHVARRETLFSLISIYQQINYSSYLS